jgi:hypothetical protein
MQVIMDKKKMPSEAKDVTEPLPGMLDPISQAYKDKMDKKKKEQEPKPKGYKSGGSVSSASKRADGCCIKGKTRGKMV